MYEDGMMKPIKYCLKRGKEGGGLREYNGDVSLFRVHRRHL
jgi:hypothetical protein